MMLIIKMNQESKVCVEFVILLALGGCSWPSLMHEVTRDFLVVHIKASQKSVGDKPKSVHIFLQTPAKCTQGNRIFSITRSINIQT